MDDDLLWLPTETGSSLHLCDEAGGFGPVDPFVAAGYRGAALCRSGAKVVVVGGFVPATDPAAPLSRPRTRMDVLRSAAELWLPIVEALEQLDALAGVERAPLVEWLRWWAAVYDNPYLQGERLSVRLAEHPVGEHRLSGPFAVAGSSGITGCCRRCSAAREGRHWDGRAPGP